MLKGRNIGRMDVLLTIEQPTKTRNSINEDELTWTTLGRFFAERTWNTGGEKFEGKQETNMDNVTFNARYNSSIDTTMRLFQENENTYFYINNVRSSRREGLTIINAVRRDNEQEQYIGDEAGFNIMSEEGYKIKTEESQ
jgi:head-tail adaptor